MNAHISSTIHTPFGPITIHINQGKLEHIHLCDGSAQTDVDNELIHDIKQQIEHYIENPQASFSIPMHLQGTEFQLKVWQALTEIPPGETRSYGELAKQLNSHARAIGQACRRNPIPIIIPCHRVVAQNTLGGFAGETGGELLTVKQWMLEHEASKTIDR